MKKFLVVLSAFLLVLSFSGVASALYFTMDDYDVNLNASDPGLVLNWSPILATPASGNFDVGDSVTVELFSIWTNETDVGSDDEVSKPISVGFSFTAPEIFDGSVSGDTSGESNWFLFGGFWPTEEQYGALIWDGPLSLNFGNGGILEISLSDANFNYGWYGLNEGPCKGAIVEATFTYAAAPVPEPGTIFLMGLSLVGLAGMGRKKLFKK